MQAGFIICILNPQKTLKQIFLQDWRSLSFWIAVLPSSVLNLPTYLMIAKMYNITTSEFLPEKPGSYCSVLVRNNTSDVTTLLTGLIGYIEIPITTVRPLHYQVKDINTLIHTVIHTYHPDITEPVKNHYQDMTQNTASFELN